VSHGAALAHVLALVVLVVLDGWLDDPGLY